MPNISKKGLAMPQSPIRKLVPFAEAAKERGIQIHKLNIGQPDIKTPTVALDAVKNIDMDVLAYSHSAGFQSYREKLALYYKKHGIEVDEDDIIISTGGSEALLFAMGSVTDPGDEIIIPEPFYANYNGFATANVAALVKKHDLFLIADEVYREFAYDGHIHHSVMKQRDIDANTIMIDSVSKRFSMCGARIGCIVSRNKELMSTAMKFAQARLSPPTFAQIASQAALETPQSYFDDVIDEYVSRRNTLVKGLEKISGVKVANPKGAFYCIVELPVKNADAFAQWLLESFNHNGKTIMVAPAAGFYSTEEVGLNQVRIAYVLEESLLKEAVEILEIALSQYNA